MFLLFENLSLLKESGMMDRFYRERMYPLLRTSEGRQKLAMALYHANRYLMFMDSEVADFMSGLAD